MVERIERVTRVRGASYDAYRSFERKDGYQDKGRSKSGFSKVLKGVMGKEATAAKAGSYAVDLGGSRATQSLFYQGGLDLGWWQPKVDAA